MKKGVFLLGTLFIAFHPLLTSLSFGEESRKTSNQTILLDEAGIQGERLEEEITKLEKKRTDLPALSTALRWDGNDITEMDIPKEILDQLTQPDLTYILEQTSDIEEDD